jgi:hypothetical protein
MDTLPASRVHSPASERAASTAATPVEFTRLLVSEQPVYQPHQLDVGKEKRGAAS